MYKIIVMNNYRVAIKRFRTFHEIIRHALVVVVVMRVVRAPLCPHSPVQQPPLDYHLQDSKRDYKEVVTVCHPPQHRLVVGVDRQKGTTTLHHTLFLHNPLLIMNASKKRTEK